MTSQPAARSAPAPQRERATSTSSQQSSKSGASKSAKAPAKSVTRAEGRKASSSSCGTDQASGDEKAAAANDLPKMSYAAILRQQEAARQNKHKTPGSASSPYDSQTNNEPAIAPAPPSDCDVSVRDSRSSSMSSLPPTSAAARTTGDGAPVTSQSGAGVGGKSQPSRHSQPPSNKAAPVHNRSPLPSATDAPDAEAGAKDAPASLTSKDGVAVSNGAVPREGHANAYVSRENGPRTFSSRGHYGRGRGGSDFHRHPRDRDYARDYTRRHDDTGAGQYGRHPREHNGPSSRGHHSNYRGGGGGGGGHYRGGGYRRHQQAPPRENRQIYVQD